MSDIDSDIDDDDEFLNSESSDEDELEMQLYGHRLKNENYLDETVPHYDDVLFLEHFRINRVVVNDIAIRFGESNQYKRHYGQHGKISALNQVIMFLWFIGHQTSSFRDVSDTFDIALSSLHRIIQRVTIFLSNLSPEIIKWPTENEKRLIEQHFRGNGFPNVIGAIDGSHIRIDKPANDPESYINRKGYYSIQVQVVCDHTKKITDVFLGYPGSVHDSRVFRNSPLGRDLEEKCGQFFLLGDSGNPLKRNLLTPFKDRGHLNHRHINYNTKLSRNRYVVEHCFGILKQNFRQMYHVKLRNIAYIVHFIRAACVLHNNEFVLQDLEPLDEPLLVQNIDVDEEEADDMEARQVRDDIVNHLPI